MSYHIRFAESVRVDIQQAHEWYEVQREGLGERFLKELETVFLKLEQSPELFSLVNHSLRKAIVRNFPFLVIFEIDNKDVIIYAVLHTSRKPNPS